jgi:hypothetical protein
MYSTTLALPGEPGIHGAMTGKTTYSKKQFAALESMCREQAALARSEMEYSQMKYWLAEAEEWKQLSTAPQALSEQRRTTNANGPRWRTSPGASQLCDM